ncbi:WbqC family protein [Paraburkholderia sp. CNPSo 3272]|uniref:WbqC family protein n=1 Tax=Paraburkholderia sp. CNPSo 3272 TaxID=2940931 RepID=UPI0020B6B226|nr:WbqC family protein [Paraburkholderia sp. CNPSo 3272]MCP3726174.1 WbqC family protein [Paraburkholderia sp. CNPSo 3272]
MQTIVAQSIENLSSRPAKKVAIVQSCYIPWKGYFDLIGSVDEFVLFDDMQYTRRDWRNRNLIKNPQGTAWLTVPVKVKGKYHQTIRETEIDGNRWQSDHWKTICQNYKRSPYFEPISTLLEPYYLEREYTSLSELNRALTEVICQQLGIRTTLKWSWEYENCEGKSERLVHLCEQAGATIYISGPAARDYIDPLLFEAAGIELQFFDYTGYSEYPQLWGEFQHGVSVIDLLFNCGDDASKYMKFPSRKLRTKID